MKHIIRLFILIAALALGTDHAWAEVNDNPRVNFVYVDGDNYALTSDKGVAIASNEAAGQVTITVTINEGKDFRCIEGDLTAEQSINSGMGQARRRTSAEGPGNGVPVPVTCRNTNEFTLTLPDDESTNVTVYVKFSEKLEFTPEVTIEDWTYGDEAKTPTITGNKSDGDVTYTYFFKDGDVTYFEPNPQNAGTYFVKATVAATADYKECESAPFEFTINRAPLTVTAKDHGIFYGNAAANNGVTYNGFVNGETESVLGGTLTYTYSNNKGPYGEGNDTPGDYVITPSGLTSNNYEITFVPGTLYVHPAHVSVRVVDKADGKGIETASVTVQVLDNGNQVTVCHIGWCADINDLKTGVTYTLRETVAPEGYVLPSDLTFTIDNEGKITSSGSTTTDEFGNTVLLLENSKTHVEISVVDVADGEEIEGAHVQVIDGNRNVVKDLEDNNVEWTSDGSTHTIEGLKTGVTYTLHETVAPDGYVRPTDYTFTIDVEGNVTTTNGTMTQEGVLLVENAKTHVEISVVDAKSVGEKLAGATVQVIDGEGNVVKDLEGNDVVWNSTSDNHIIEGLKTGVPYTLHETNAPERYVLPTDDITFTIDETGKITSTGTITEGGVLLLKNTMTRVKISVVDKVDGTPLVGPTVQAIDSEGNVVEQCITGEGNPVNYIEGLKTGVEYTLHEISVPEGYVSPADYTFRINTDGKVTYNGPTTEDGVLLVENSKTHVEISVVDAKSVGEKLAGAHVQVIDSESSVFDEWDSTTEPHVIEGLKTNVEYTLHETAAPNRYAAPADYTFKIAPDGSITFTGNKTENGVLLVENTQTGDLIVSNTLVSDLASDANQVFTFAVKATLNDQPISGTYGGMTFDENGKTTFTLTKGGSMTAKDLLYGTTYTVNQVEAEGFTLEKTGDTGTIGQEYSTAAFTNKRKTGKLIVTNTVYSDSESDANQEFEFKVTLGDRSISGTYGGMTFVSGETTFTLTNGGSMTATDLPTTMTYTVTGRGVSGFQLSGSTGVEGTIGNEASTATFKYIKLIDVSVAIIWNDANNQDGKRPSAVSVILKVNGEQVGLNDGNDWSYTFENQPSCTQEGNPIEYSWEMPATPGSYTLSEPTVDGHNTTLTLTHEPEKTQVTVQAIWEDENNKEGFRPENVNVKLISHLMSDDNGELTSEDEATLNAGNGWSHTWKVDKYANGQEVTFTVSQDKLDNYNAPVIAKDNEAPLTYNVTNSRTVEKTEVTVSIVWGDQNNQEGFRPESVTVHLMKDDKDCEAIVLSNSNNWTHTWANLQKYENATEIDYTVTEDAVANYSTQITKATDGTLTYNVTNSRTVEVIDVHVAIVWDDDDNKNGLRPDNVTTSLKLLANGAEKTGNQWTALNNGPYIWMGLPKYADGKEIEYTISQEQLVNYNAPVITKGNESEWEYTVTNTICGVIFTTDENSNSTTLTLTNPTALQEVSIPDPVEVDHVNIQREFIPETAATVYLPFTIAAENVEGGQFYSFTDVDETKNPWEVSYTEVIGDIVANTPYIFLPDNSHGGKITVNNGENKVSVCTANAQTTHDAESQWEFIGTYQPIKWLSDHDAEGYTAERAAEIGSVYGFAASSATVGTTEFTAGQFVKVASGAYIKPYRAYLKRSTTSGARGHNGISSPELPATMNVVLISANGVTVSVGTINLDCESGDWYSLDGRKLDAQPTKKGMYIHNNKKVIIK